MDLPRDLFTERLTLRRLRVLVENLPDDSAFHRANPKRAGWTLANHQLARIADVLNAANWQRQRNPDAKRPAPEWRPGAPAPVDEKQAIRDRALAWRNRRRGVT